MGFQYAPRLRCTSRTSEWTSPLIEAIHRNHEDVVWLLLKYNADINRRGEDGNPAVHLAARLGYLTIVRLLLDYRGADIDLIGGSGRPAYWYAAEAGNKEIETLLKQHALSHNQLVASYDPDIANDLNQPMIACPQENLYQEIEQIQHYYTLDTAREAFWMRNLRFVVPAPPESHGEFDLDLIQPYHQDASAADTKPYIAVSYCWGSPAVRDAASLLIRIPDKPPTDGYSIRTTSVRPDVLHRSLAFAKAKGIERIWIDQECIHQNDDEDKRSLINVMHKIYQRAAVTLIVLGHHILSSDDAKILPHLQQPRGPCDDLRDRIFGDRWFRRAWTTQEYVNSAKSRLAYLVGFNSGLDDAWREACSAASSEYPEQNVVGEWVLSSNNIFQMSFMTMGFRGAMVENLVDQQTDRANTFTLCHPAISNMPWWRDTSKVFASALDNGEDSSTKELIKPQTHLSMSIIAALAMLEQRQNLLVSDRISILANLCQYPSPLNVKHAIRGRNSLTASVIAMALFNGDLSFFFDRPLPRSSHGEIAQPTWMPPVTRSLSSLNKTQLMPFHILTGRSVTTGNPILVINGKLLVRGVIWEVSPFTDLLPLQNSVRDMLNICRNTNSSATHSEIGQILLEMLVRQLISCGQLELLELVIASARSDQFSTPAEIMSLIGELQSWYDGHAAWPLMVTTAGNTSSTGQSDVRGLRSDGSIMGVKSTHHLDDRLAIFDLSGSVSSELAPSSDPFGRLPPQLGDDILTLLYCSISIGAPIPVGTLHVGGERLHAIFKLDLSHHKHVFVPVNELNYEFGSNPLLHILTRQALWCITPTGAKMLAWEMGKAMKVLTDVTGANLPVAEEIWVNQGASDIYGAWSPRLCSNGYLAKDHDSKSWKMITLDGDAVYHVFA
ncbi:hypothetical protein HGRIS_005104 [Hohenbuehelia grisea]|uniref:Heterokaryon incompatibility domain-containing protein n=1 Tax=Hohenbuehelia grisea TaxID=104357 RepID=A0ABR3JEV2_9AGAR